MNEISKQKMLSWLITTKSHAVVLFDQENIPYSQEDEATFNEIYRLIESSGEKDVPLHGDVMCEVCGAIGHLLPAPPIPSACGQGPQYEAAPPPPADDVFIAHIQSHLKPGQEVVCKICGRTAKEICGEKPAPPAIRICPGCGHVWDKDDLVGDDFRCQECLDKKPAPPPPATVPRKWVHNIALTFLKNTVPDNMSAADWIEGQFREQGIVVEDEEAKP